MYSPQVLDHFQNPRNVGELNEPTAVEEASNPVCGDVMKLWILVQDGRVMQVAFRKRPLTPATWPWMPCARCWHGFSRVKAG